ncbi:MAG: hypothetical protein ACT4PL_06665 [Phycisphaerales bacterium]
MMIHKALRHAALLAPLAGVASLATLAGCAADNSAPLAQADPAVRIREAQQLVFEGQGIEDEARAGRARNLSPDEIKALQNKAVAKYQQAILVYRDFAPAWNNMGSMLMDLGDNMGAMEAFRTAADLAPLDPKPIANVGVIWQRMGYLSDASKAYDEALKRNPTYLPALRQSVVIDLARRTVTETTAERVKQAQLLEQDPTWRTALARHKIAIEEMLAGGTDNRAQ